MKLVLKIQFKEQGDHSLYDGIGILCRNFIDLTDKCLVNAGMGKTLQLLPFFKILKNNIPQLLSVQGLILLKDLLTEITDNLFPGRFPRLNHFPGEHVKINHLCP